MSRNAMFLGDSIWREARRTLLPAEAKATAERLESQLEPGFGLKVATDSLDDARAIAAHISKANLRRLIFCHAAVGKGVNHAM